MRNNSKSGVTAEHSIKKEASLDPYRHLHYSVRSPSYSPALPLFSSCEKGGQYEGWCGCDSGLGRRELAEHKGGGGRGRVGSEEGGNKKEVTTQNTSQHPICLVPVFYHLIGCVLNKLLAGFCPVWLGFPLFVCCSKSRLMLAFASLFSRLNVFSSLPLPIRKRVMTAAWSVLLACLLLPVCVCVCCQKEGTYKKWREANAVHVMLACAEEKHRRLLSTLSSYLLLVNWAACYSCTDGWFATHKYGTHATP